MADKLDLDKYNGDFSSIITNGGIPVTDINIKFDPNKTTSRSKGFNVSASQFASRAVDAPRTVIYGRAKVGGTVVLLTTDQGQSGQFLHIGIVIAGHEIDAVEKLYLDGREVTFGGGTVNTDARWGLTGTEWDDKVFMSVSTGSENQPANADLVAQSAGLFPGIWTVEHRLRGCAFVYLILVYNETLFANSVPSVQFLIRGKKVLDTRTNVTSWSANAALCAADYLASSQYGCKAGYARIDTTALNDAANICDEDIGLAGGGTEKRYTVNGVFETSQSRKNILQSFTAALGSGYITRISNTWFIFPGKWRPPTLTLNENDLRSGLRVQVKNSRRDSFNGVKGTYVSPDNDWQPVDFPAQKSSFYLAQDGGVEKYEDIALEFIASNATAQRIAKIILEKARQPISVDGLWSLRAYALVPGDTVAISLARYGWVAKPFEVITSRPDVDPNGATAIALSLRETAETLHDWNNGQETLVDLAPDTYLPSPASVIPIGTLLVESGTAQLLKNGDGTIITRAKLTWPQSTDPFGDEIQIEFKQSSEAEWQRAPNVDAVSSTAYIANLQDGIEYDFRVRVINGSGFVSSWSQLLAQEIIGKTEPPSDVVNFNASALADGIFLSWNQIPDIDRQDYVLKVGGPLSDWDSATEVEAIKSTTYKLRTQIAGTYKFFIRARDTSGNLSFLPSGTTVVIPGPSVPNAIFQFSAENVIFSWAASTSFFAIDHYELSFGLEFSTSQPVAQANSTTISLPANWNGYRNFYLVAVDQGGNKSAPQTIPVLIQASGKVSAITPNSIGHFVTLHWTPPASGTLNVSRYRISKGANFASAELVGEFFGTFTTIFETVGGNYTYWIQPIDVGGNLGTEEFVTVSLSAPSDFVLKADQLISDFTIKSNVFKDPEGFFIGPFNPSETWEGHFQNRGWQDIGQQIDAGFLYYAQPGATDGYVETIIDFGVSFPSTALLLDFDKQVLDGTLAFEPYLSWSADNSSYSSPVSGAAAFATNCRYVKIRIDFNGTNSNSLGLIKNVRLKASVKLETDQGTATANSGDSGGTTVNFNLDFLDVESIVITPLSTTEVRWAYDFTDTPNPTSFKVLVWDSSGNRVTKTISWTARGAVT